MAATHVHGVFVNCPFDDGYRPLFDAIVYAIHDCGYAVRSALEVKDSADLRLSKIQRIIGECQLGIHDISRTELDATTGLPRFNMPLELGLFLGARHFGNVAQKRKSCLILDRDLRRYEKFISDIKGMDIEAHADDSAQAIHAVRDWLDARSVGILPDGTEIARRFGIFVAELPGICQAAKLRVDRLTFKNYVQLVQRWLKLNP